MCKINSWKLTDEIILMVTPLCHTIRLQYVVSGYEAKLINMTDIRNQKQNFEKKEEREKKEEEEKRKIIVVCFDSNPLLQLSGSDPVPDDSFEIQEPRCPGQKTSRPLLVNLEHCGQV